VSPVKYELGFYTPEDAILHSHLKSYIETGIHCLDAGIFLDFPLTGFASANLFNDLPRSGPVRFVMVKGALGQVPSEYFGLPCH
jgi:hypothetical protein